MERVTITLDYENGKSFEMKVKEGADPTISIVKVQENSNISSIWTNVSSICNTYFASLVEAAGSEMKKPSS